jgi:hypothetical protein
MSVAHPPTPAPRSPERKEITIVSHSTLFYWWPVWAVGFLMAILTAIDDHRMVTVPKGSLITEAKQITYKNRKEDIKEHGDWRSSPAGEVRDVVVLPKDQGFDRNRVPELKEAGVNPRLHIARSKSYGVLFAFVLLLVIVITNVPLRGMWSVLVIISVITLALIFHLAGWWESILRNLSLLDIRINMGGYLFISGVLFAAWLITLLFFDRQLYVKFTPGQIRVCTEIGAGEKVEDAAGVSLEKQRGDIFRHSILGLGSGDLIVKTAGARPQHFDLHNVLFIRRKLQQIEEMLREKKVTVEAK